MKYRRILSVLIISKLLLLVMLSGTSISARGIVGQSAPDWSVDKWINLPDDRDKLSISDYRGKVLYLFFFQSWCPGCHSHGVPTLQEVQRQFVGGDDLEFVAIQTVFEGFAVNRLKNAREFAERHSLTFPVGHSGEQGIQSPLLSSYQSGGTPWTIIIDRKGIVRFNGFSIKPQKAVKLVKRLLNNPAGKEE